MSKVNLKRVKAGDLELKEKVVGINRVVKTTKGGRAFSFSALVVVGNAAFKFALKLLLVMLENTLGLRTCDRWDSAG